MVDNMNSMEKILKSINENLERIANALEKFSEGQEVAEDYDINERISYREENQEVPKEIESKTSKELAKDLITFIKKEFSDEDIRYIGRFSNMFWNQMNFQKWNAPANIQLKIEKAENIAQKLISEEIEKKEKEQLEQERKELPKLVDKCVEWASEKGLKRVTKSDVDVFLMEIDKTVLPATKNQLYAITNVEIKSKT